MSILLVTLLAFAQSAACEAPPVQRALGEASAHVEAFDLPGAVRWLGSAGGFGCDEVELRAAYLEGLLAAREAYRQGGSATSLEPVRHALSRLDGAAAGRVEARIAGYVLRAAIAGAQSERDEMAIYLEHATAMERLRILAGDPGAPMLSAHEVAGDLWLQVHRYGDAADAYARAVEEVGPTPAVQLGLARSAVRLGDEARACREYGALTAGWRAAPSEPPEIVEARAFLERVCGTSPPQEPRR